MRKLKKDLWPYCIAYNKTGSDSDFREVEEWLGEHIGCYHEKWNAVYHYDHTDLYFKDNKDAVWFSVRWS